MSLETFIENNINEDTISDLILRQQQIIKAAEKRISQLEKMEEEENNKQWFEREGVRFVRNNIIYNRRHREETDQTRFKNYTDFIAAIIREMDDLKKDEDYDSCEFEVISPTGSSYSLEDEDYNNLPFVKEYFKRQEVYKEVNDLHFKIGIIQKKVEVLEEQASQKEKFTPEYIETLLQEISQLLNEKKEIEEANNYLEKVKRLEYLDELLKDLKL